MVGGGVGPGADEDDVAGVFGDELARMTAGIPPAGVVGVLCTLLTSIAVS